MPTDSTTTADFVLTLSAEQRALLVEMLTHALGETRVEAHHTDNPTYRESVRHQAEVIKSILEGLREDSSV